MSTTNELDQLVALITSSVEQVKQEYQRLECGVPDLDSIVPHALDNVQPTIAFKQAVQTIEGACAQLSLIVTTPQHTITNRGLSHFETACLQVVVRANITDILKEHPDGLHVSVLAKKTGMDAGKLGRCMRLLASRHCFREVKSDVFTNNRLSIKLGSQDGIHFLIGHFTDELFRSATCLYDTLTDKDFGPSYESNKTPFNKCMDYDKPLFDWYAHVSPERGERFGKGMVGWGSGIGAGALLTGFPWNELPEDATVCDLGGGVGNISLQLVESFPNLRIVLQDLEGTIEQAKVIWQDKAPKALKEQRAEFVPIDFFKESPVPGCDVYYMKNILHDWPDAECKKILANVKKSMKSGSKLVIHEYVLQHVMHENTSIIPQAPAPLLPNYGEGRIRQYYVDLDMMVMLNAKERTFDEFIKLGTECGLKFFKLWDFGETSAVEFTLPA